MRALRLVCQRAGDSVPFLEKREPFLGVAVGMGGHILKLVPRLPPVPAETGAWAEPWTAAPAGFIAKMCC